MKIFVLLPRIPFPLEKGDKLRAFNQIKQLAKHNEIILCALNDNSSVNEQEAFHALQPYCQSINFIRINKLQILLGLARAFFKGLPMQCGYFFNRKAAKKVDSVIAKHKPDLLYGQLLRVAEYRLNDGIEHDARLLQVLLACWVSYSAAYSLSHRAP